MKLALVAFSWKRVMFGSVWPVCLVAGNYKKVKDIVVDFIVELSLTQQEAILGENAIEFHNIEKK